jgi:hypothetical protein
LHSKRLPSLSMRPFHSTKSFETSEPAAIRLPRTLPLLSIAVACVYAAPLTGTSV